MEAASASLLGHRRGATRGARLLPVMRSIYLRANSFRRALSFPGFRGAGLRHDIIYEVAQAYINIIDTRWPRAQMNAAGLFDDDGFSSIIIAVRRRSYLAHSHSSSSFVTPLILKYFMHRFLVAPVIQAFQAFIPCQLTCPIFSRYVLLS